MQHQVIISIHPQTKQKKLWFKLTFFTWVKCGGFVDSMTCDNDDTQTEKWRQFMLATLRTLNRFNSVKKINSHNVSRFKVLNCVFGILKDKQLILKGNMVFLKHYIILLCKLQIYCKSTGDYCHIKPPMNPNLHQLSGIHSQNLKMQILWSSILLILLKS